MKRLFIFLGLTFVLTWIVEFTLMANGGLSGPYAYIVLAGIMFIPALSVVITRLITKEGFKNFGLKPRFKGHIRYYVTAWFAPSLLIVCGALFYFLISPSHFDLTMSNMFQLYRAQGADATQSTLMASFLAQVVVGLLFGPLLNIITTLGEEIGWRGYLLPKLMEMVSGRKAVAISGAIWGLWHAPVIAMGYNYGFDYAFFPWGGILAMIVFGFFAGSFLSYLAIRTKSVLPAAIAHGSLNGFAAISVWVTIGQTSPFIGPLPVGIIGGFGLIVLGTVCFYLIGQPTAAAASDANPS
ncbi:type II CAAX endopeptidase family protein [Acetobacterium sp.]|uniref:CPBP family intramembrane glutamic endopeptidase n=1 Tax=Acetobacterium sp. TaxID=1872094 RepID=UPI002F40E51B